MTADRRTAPPPPPTPVSRAAPTGPARRLAVPGGLFALAAGALAYVGVVDPGEGGHYPVCPLYRLTGLYCPGCGGLRATHALLHGDVLTALRDNALGVAACLACAVLWTVWVIRTVGNRPPRFDPGPAHLWAAGVLLLAFTIVRNLPFGGWLHP
ncbi:DUF2752 domain-containing protein [Streptomyces sp. NPDC048362]|uniref:DUF2752 domain-containing protein n=1 Tax=Streptomyces sp. NPDC048362 TaxID=3365539 RepID=UPI003716866F